MKNLVIVESPTKAKTIGKYLGKDYTIKFSMGHIMDLPKSKLGVDVDGNFAPQYETIADKKALISELKTLAKSADTILLATDPDREGEAIAANIKEVLTADKKAKITDDKFKRIVFHEITEEAIKEAAASPRDVDQHLVDAQTARRVLDRLVGYQLSPLLWKKVRRGLSAGRVQSIALRLIVEREREIEKFAKQAYFSIHAILATPQKEKTEFELIDINNEKVETQEKHALYAGEYKITKTSITTPEQAEKVVADIQKKQFIVEDVLEKETKRSPQPPFTTSTLQQEASRRYGFAGKRTMSLAQKLYEEGFITYHRTDSVTMAASAVTKMQQYITATYGKQYVPEKPRSFSAKQKLAQEAHEAIRPTHISRESGVVSQELGNDYGKLYELIWRRALASQMSDALVESTTVFVAVQGDKNSYRFKANGSVLVFDGFLKINPQALQDNRLPKFTVKEVLQEEAIRADQHETPAPPRYNDASLIGILEDRGIGRPSTYASIISTITDRGYIERIEKKFIPTAIGIAVNDFLVTNFSTIDDIPFTAAMEDQLDNIAHGKEEWVTMMKEFYGPFSKKIEEVEGADRVKIAVEKTGEACPQCDAELVIRTGKFGKFISCSNFPECKFTKPFVEETNAMCPKDGGKVVVKKTRKGRKFFGCANYPNCEFAAWKLEDIKGAPAEEQAATTEGTITSS